METRSVLFINRLRKHSRPVLKLSLEFTGSFRFVIQVWFVLFQLSLNVAEFNVLSLFHELAHREKYVPPSVEEKSKENTLNQGGATIRGRAF